MSTIPSGDSEIFAFSPEQFFALVNEDRREACLAPPSSLSTQQPWNNTGLPSAHQAAFPKNHAGPIYPALNPLQWVDDMNEKLKDTTYVDMFGWKDAITDGRTAIKQVMLLGIMGDAYLTRTRAGKEAIIFKGRPGLRAKLPGTRYLRDHPVVREAGFVIGHKEILEEAGKAVKIGVICFVAWDIVHELLQDKPNMTRLGVSILSDIFQCAASTYVGVVVGMVFGAIFGSIVITFVAVALGTLLAGAALTALDKNFGLTEKAITIASNIEKSQPLSSFIEFAKKENANYAISHSNPISYISY